LPGRESTPEKKENNIAKNRKRHNRGINKLHQKQDESKQTRTMYSFDQKAKHNSNGKVTIKKNITEE